MDINKLNNHSNQVNGQVRNTDASESSQSASKISRADESNSFTDKVSLENSGAKKSEQLFAQIELEKLNQSSFGKLKAYKAKLQEYEAAKNESPEAAANTEIGKMLNDSDVWGKIAENIIDK